MIVKNATFILNLLTKKLYRSKALETIECSKWTNSNSGASFGLFLDSTIEKIIQILISRSLFLKKKNKIEFFRIIKEQNNSHHSSLLIGPNGFLNNTNLLYLFSVLNRFWSF